MRKDTGIPSTKLMVDGVSIMNLLEISMYLNNMFIYSGNDCEFIIHAITIRFSGH